MDIELIRKVDPEIAEALDNELHRQRFGLEMIPSENFPSRAVLETMASVMNNKYAEGYPGKRYYGGNQFIDVAENLAIERAKKLFGVDHANVQPNAGSAANMAAYYALLETGDTFMSLRLDLGGHLSHGSPVNFSGKLYKPVFYEIDKETHTLDYDEIRKRALAEKPKLILCGYTAYPRSIDFKAFREIADEVGAYMMADIAHIAGLIVGKVHQDPAPYADVITTTTHKTLRGPRSAIVMCKEEYVKPINKAVFPGLQGGPLEHMIAAKAVCFHEAARPEFAEYAKQIVKNAKTLADGLMEHGFSLISGGTDNHLVLIDMTNKGLTGREAQDALDAVDITTNKNMIPYDTRKPMDPSGIRLGTPALTSRGMGESEMNAIADLINTAIDKRDDESAKQKIREDIEALCKQFPLYPDL